ncbi:MAG: HAD family hydrolase [Patescibacteria group bacterium]
MIEAILFDLDGTLVDTLPLYIKSYKQALLSQGFNLTDREIVGTCFGKTEESICAKLGIPSQAEEFKRSYFSGVRNHYREGRLFKRVIDFLDLAKEKKIKLAIVSFAYNWYVNEMLKRLKLDRYFNTVIGFNDVKKAKPDPEAAILACNKFNTSPSESIVVGDSKSDIVMGKNAGCKTVLFHPDGYDLFYDLNSLKESRPDKVIKDFSELKEFVMN